MTPSSTSQVQTTDLPVVLNAAGRVLFAEALFQKLKIIDVGKLPWDKLEVPDWKPSPTHYRTTMRQICENFLQNVLHNVEADCQPLCTRERLDDIFQEGIESAASLAHRAGYEESRYPVQEDRVHQAETARLTKAFTENFLSPLSIQCRRDVFLTLENVFRAPANTQYAVECALRTETEGLKGLLKDAFLNALQPAEKTRYATAANITPQMIEPDLALSNKTRARQVAQAFARASHLQNITLTNTPNGGLRKFESLLTDQEKLGETLGVYVTGLLVLSAVNARFEREYGLCPPRPADRSQRPAWEQQAAHWNQTRRSWVSKRQPEMKQALITDMLETIARATQGLFEQDTISGAALYTDLQQGVPPLTRAIDNLWAQKTENREEEEKTLYAECGWIMPQVLRNLFQETAQDPKDPAAQAPTLPTVSKPSLILK